MTVICDARAAECRCVLELGHDGPHACVVDCGGQWTGDINGPDFHAVELPIGWLLPEQR